MIAKIFLSIGVLLAIAFIVLVIIQVRNEQEVERIWRSLESSPAENRFTKDMVAELPAPVQRYFLHSIALGTPLASSVSLEMSGSFRMAQDKPWIPMRAKQITSALKGFVWKAVIGSGLFNFMGADWNGTKKSSKLCSIMITGIYAINESRSSSDRDFL
ncbi:DUF6544 family protein [Komarekiella delphini-convector]|uniref:DUF6544 family protein n=1 Tax=Komarekiella delphini-convector TaxID=3050158 RepID=UPI001CD888E6|nr:DUF6544 family protein [Komarekiella delphini-convector]